MIMERCLRTIDIEELIDGINKGDICKPATRDDSAERRESNRENDKSVEADTNGDINRKA